MPVARLGGGNSFAFYWLNLVILINHLIFVEIQVDYHGSDVYLKIVLVWVLLSHVGLQAWYKFFILKVMFICIYTFLNHKLFENHYMHLLLVLALLRD